MLERPPDPRRVHLPRNAHDDDYAAAGNFHLPHLKGETPGVVRLRDHSFLSILKPESIVLDCGANIGNFAVDISQR